MNSESEVCKTMRIKKNVTSPVCKTMYIKKSCHNFKTALFAIFNLSIS